MEYHFTMDRVEIINVVLHSYNIPIKICYIIRFCDVLNKSLTSVISLIKNEKNGTYEKNIYDFILNFNNYEINK